MLENGPRNIPLGIPEAKIRLFQAVVGGQENMPRPAGGVEKGDLFELRDRAGRFDGAIERAAQQIRGDPLGGIQPRGAGNRPLGGSALTIRAPGRGGEVLKKPADRLGPPPVGRGGVFFGQTVENRIGLGGAGEIVERPLDKRLAAHAVKSAGGAGQTAQGARGHKTRL